MIILPGSQSPFTENELKVLKNYLHDGGGKILILLFETNKGDISNTNILLEEFGIIPEISIMSLNFWKYKLLFSFTDSLIRTHYCKYFHPKECYINDCTVNSSLNKEKANMNLVYPFGCTITVMKPSVVAFTSGSTTFPVDRPLGAIYSNGNTGKWR